MRTIVTWILGCALIAAPVAARADWSGCLIGPTDLNRCSVGGAPAAALAAIAAPVLLAGAAVSIEHELRKKTEERLPDGVTPASVSPNGTRTQPNLTLVPEPPDPYRAPPGRPETRHKPSAAFQFNENATNIATVVTGAAVVGAMIATIVKDAKAAHK
jgi:hypothetical protein